MRRPGTTKDNRPIFIVGAPRSGTTLLAAMLSAHPRLSCGPETHFYVSLAQCENSDRFLAPQSWPADAAGFLESTRPEGEAIYRQYGLDKQALSDALNHRPASRRAMLESLTAHYCRCSGKERWIEKTPDHVLHLETIRQDFPDSPIVRIVRDPRDVCMSLLRMPWVGVPRRFSDALLIWMEKHQAAEQFLNADSNNYTLRYEDLVTEPEAELKRLCAFLGEDFNPQMLDTSQSSRRLVSATNAAWHKNLGKPMDRSRLQVWKRDLGPDDVWLTEAIAGHYLRQFNYDFQGPVGCYTRVYPAVENVYEHVAAIASFSAAHRLRFWKEHPNERPSGLLCIGNPEAPEWIGRQGRPRRRDLAACCKMILGAAIARHPIVWMKPTDREPPHTKASVLLSTLLRAAHRVPYTGLYRPALEAPR